MFTSQKLKPGKWAELPGGANTANGAQRVGVAPVLLPGLFIGLRDLQAETSKEGWRGGAGSGMGFGSSSYIPA